MQTVVVHKTGRDVYHGTRNDVGGSAGTNDNGMSIKSAIAIEVYKYIRYGETYRLEVNGEDKGIFTK
jgi:hypothetical protein